MPAKILQHPARRAAEQRTYAERLARAREIEAELERLVGDVTDLSQVKGPPIIRRRVRRLIREFHVLCREHWGR